MLAPLEYFRLHLLACLCLCFSCLLRIPSCAQMRTHGVQIQGTMCLLRAPIVVTDSYSNYYYCEVLVWDDNTDCTTNLVN